MSLSCGIKSGG